MKTKIFIMLSLCFYLNSTTAQESLTLLQEISKEWVALTEYKNETVILHPCDTINDTFRIDTTDPKHPIIHFLTGQEAVSFSITAIKKEKNVYYFVYTTPYEPHPIENALSLEILDTEKGLGRWKVNDFIGEQFVNAAHKHQYKEVEQPCKECWDECPQ